MAKPSLESCRVDPGDSFQYLVSYSTKMYLDEKIEIDEKISKIIFLTNFLKGYFKGLPEKPFFSKKNRKFGFNFTKSLNHYSQLKKQVKVDQKQDSSTF